MSLPRLDHATQIADRLNELAAIVKTRSRASLTDANHILETVVTHFFNALFGWKLINLNIEHANHPAADLGDRRRRIAVQVTNADGSEKIEHTARRAIKHKLGTRFRLLIVFFLLPRKPDFPKKFVQPCRGPKIETWDIADLLKQMQEMRNLKALTRAAKILDDEMGKIPASGTSPYFDISRITDYAPEKLIGRDSETKLLKDAWGMVRNGTKKRPHILTFVALGGEGKTSLIAKWAVELAHQDWPGCDAAFAWSFYRDGADERTSGSSDLFLKEALTFFGDPEMAGSATGAFEKGRRLAQLVGKRRALLILDGVEPLQYAPTSSVPGQLKDQGLAALLKFLAGDSHGLCVVSTRYSLPELKAYWQATVLEVPLLRLTRAAGMHLLKILGVRGAAKECETLVEEVKGHALTLSLLGTFLRDAHGGDIRKRDLVKLEEADAEEQGGHAFRVMEAYELALAREGERGKRALAVLRLIGLFDRPATADCLDALLKAPSISGLTEQLAGVTEEQLNLALSRLESAKLITKQLDDSATRYSSLVIRHSLDAHPLLREYFARQLCTKQPNAWRAAHRRLYEHLSRATSDRKPDPTIEDLRPLYHAAAHGCMAGMLANAFRLYTERIQRRKLDLLEGGFYATYRLGAFGSNLGCLLHFHETERFLQDLGPVRASFLLQDTAFHLRALGRINEALSIVKPSWTKLAGNPSIPHRQLADLAGIYANTLKVRGDLQTSLEIVERAVLHSRASRNVPMLIHQLANRGDVLHCAGRYDQARMSFDEALRLSNHAGGHALPIPKFWSGNDGFKYWQFLLSERKYAIVKGHIREFLTLCDQGGSGSGSRQLQEHVALALCCLGQLFLSGARSWNLGGRNQAQKALQQSETTLRRFSGVDLLPHVLLVRSHCLKLFGDGQEAVRLLNEAWDIAERGPMFLFMADIHLHRARLFFRQKPYPWESSAADLAAAENLINECGYHRRDEELADAKRAILGA